MSYIDETGVYLDNFAEIKERWISDLQEIFGEGVNTDNAARFGQFINIVSERTADQNELIQLIANSQDPTAAIGVWLEQIVRINGIDKNEAEYSTVPVQLTANAAGCTVIAGDTFEDVDTGEKFALDTTTVVAPSATETATATAINPGSIECATGKLTIINNPRYGFASVSNNADATLGALEENSADLRIRREAKASQTGNTSPAALYSQLADLDNVTEAKVFVNKDSATDVETGLPGHSMWPIVVGGTEEDVAATIFNFWGGQGMYGNNTYNYPDPVTGATWPITWSYGVEVPIYIEVRTKKITGYPGDGDARIKQNIVDFFAGTFTVNGESIPAFGLSVDVSSGRLYTPCNVVPGHELIEIRISTSPGPTSTDTITITPEQYAGTEIANINIVDPTP